MKHKEKKKHLERPYNIRQAVPQSFVEAPGCSQEAGENASSSEYFTCVSSPYTLAHHDEDGFHQLGQNVSYPGALNMPVSQSARKRKIMEGHIEGYRNTQQGTPWLESPVEAPGCSQEAGENASSSEYFTCVSSPYTLAHRDEDGFHQLGQNVSYPGALNMPVSQSARKRKIMEGHIEGYRNTQQDTPWLESPVEAPGCSQEAGENASSSEYFTCVSSPYTLPHRDEDGYRNTQQDTPWLESPVESPGCSQEAGENASSCEYFTCDSSPSKLPRYNEEGIQERLVSKDLVQMKRSSDYSYTSISSHSASNKDPFMASVCGTDLRLMKIYYMHVQMKRGVAVLCQTEEGWEPPSKKTKIEEMTYIKEVHKNVPLSHMPGKNLLIFSEPSVDSRAQEKREKADYHAKPPTLVVYRRVQLQKALESRFRCMACCHVFPTLELLKEHVENGIRGGFSCHVFHRAMAIMKYKRLKRKNKKLMKATLSCQEKKHFNMKTNLKN